MPRAELTERYHIVGACTLVKASNTNSVPIRLLNPTTQPIQIYRRTRLGTLSPVSPDTFELLRADQEAEQEREVLTAVDADPPSPLESMHNTQRIMNRLLSLSSFSNVKFWNAILTYVDIILMHSAYLVA